MKYAISLGEKGKCSAAPNPWVGCILVKKGKIVGKGYHSSPGTDHAEKKALLDAGENARGSTAYITLEPCSHHGKTPPCAEALIKAKIFKAFVAIKDPDPNVSGKGLEKLKQAGIPVELGVCRKNAISSLLPYLHQRITGKPYCILKAAISIDGRIAASDGSSKWISNKQARESVHRLRAESQAIIIGSGTALKDAPSLTVRLPTSKKNFKQPLRVLLDGNGSVPAEGALFDQSLAPTLIMTTKKAPDESLRSWRLAGAEIEVIPCGKNLLGVDLDAALDILGKKGVLQALIEGGSLLNGSFLKSGLIDRLRLYIGSCSIGEKGIPLFNGIGSNTMDELVHWRLTNMKSFSGNAQLDYKPKGENKCLQGL